VIDDLRGLSDILAGAAVCSFCTRDVAPAAP
jgi:hypothetical protein